MALRTSWKITENRPDHCNGGFDQFCDPKRRYSNISLILVDAGRADLLQYMSEFWKDYQGDDAHLWQHEWEKHGTCVSTLETRCYENYQPQQDVVDYFDKSVEIFKQVPSYEVGGMRLHIRKAYALTFGTVPGGKWYRAVSFPNLRSCGHRGCPRTGSWRSGHRTLPAGLPE